MTLYFETPLNIGESNTINLNVKWHPNFPLLAIASYSQEKGGFVTIFNELGESTNEANWPFHKSFQVTSLSWHPDRVILSSGWENGEIKIWNDNDKNFFNISGPHKAPITHTEFSEKGGRLVSCDSSGSFVGWKVDPRGQVVTVFHLDLKECITHLTFRITVKSADYDVKDLAKAAIEGDERALDMFSNWRPKTTAKKFRVQEGTDNMCFFVGTQAGSLYYVNATGSCAEVLNTEGIPLTNIIYHPAKDVLVVMMEGLTVGHFSVDLQGNLTELAKVKLSGKMQSRDGSQGLTWAGNSSLAILTGDLTVRMWDLDSNDNFVLPTSMKLYLSDEKKGGLSENFNCISYCRLNQTISAGTNVGRIYFWTRNAEASGENAWELNNINGITGTIKHLTWGSIHNTMPLLCVNSVTSVYVMKEQNICATYSRKIWAMQKTASQVLLESENSNELMQLETQVTAMAINENYVVFSNNRIITTYQIKWADANATFELNSKLSKPEAEKEFSFLSLCSFPCDNESLLLFNDNVIVLTTRGIQLKNVATGTTVGSISNVSTEGEAIGMSLTANFLTVFTMEGFFKVYDLTSEKGPTVLIAPQNVADMCEDFGEIIFAKVNSSGTKVAMTIASANLVPDGKLYIWDSDSGTMVTTDFRRRASGGNSYDEDGTLIEPAETHDDALAGFDEAFVNRMPVSFFWNDEDPRLLVCCAKKIRIPNESRQEPSKSGSKVSLKNEDQILAVIFVSPEHGVKVHYVRPLEAEAMLLTVATPHIVTLQKLSIVRELMNDFVGLEDYNKATRDAVLDFSYNLSLGNMDAAFKAIKQVQSVGVWKSLARMCVKTRRLDVAGVCLGHMGDARAARELRLAITDPTLPLEAKLAVLAIQLGMLDEAEQLYIQCERYDLLNRLLRSQDKLDEAYTVAVSRDRIHLRNTEHAWARALEQAGEFKEAAQKYEQANTHRFDIPRMLIDQPEHLQMYMSKTTDPELLKWWGQYIESQGDMQAALKIYSKAGDVYSQVRVLCFLGEESKAADLARNSCDKAAFYHMARHYETIGNNENAVNFFTRANAYSNAIRLCKENHMPEELWEIGSVASNREKLECAAYFEDVGNFEKAVILYHRSGMLHKALDLAFKGQQYDILQQIATELNAESDPALVEKCARYFVDNEQFDKAVDLLAIAKKFEEAINICTSHNVQLTEDLVEKLTPDKEELEEHTRIRILENLAESLMVQGHYHMATKKFTQAGDKIRAMKALLKSGDTDKITFFATVSRQKEIYIMAANYLQSLDWQNQPEVLRNIITFYSKGKALDLLANFYVACAQVEIDEFQNYEKAFGALNEASRCLAKISNPKDPMQHQRITDIVQHRLTAIKRFVDIRKLFERGDISAGLTQCRQLLMTGGQDLEASVRRGDIYAVMIYHCVKAGNFADAKDLFNELKQMLVSAGSVPITYYLNKELIEALARGLNVSVSLLVPKSVKTANESNEGEIEEVIED